MSDNDTPQSIVARPGTEQPTLSDGGLMIAVLPVAEPILEITVSNPPEGIPQAVSLRGIRNDWGVDASVQDEDSIYRLLERLAPAIVKSLLRGSAVVIASRPILNFPQNTASETASQLSGGDTE
jgi:hypothetical protein